MGGTMRERDPLVVQDRRDYKKRRGEKRNS